MSRKRKAHRMSQSDLFMEQVGERCGWWLRASYSGSRAKEVARLLDLSEQQAKRLLAGARPTSEQLGRLAKHFGWRFVNFVMEPAVGTPAMFAEMDAFERRLARLEAEKEAEDARGAVAMAREDSGAGPEARRVVRQDEAKAHSRRTGT